MNDEFARLIKEIIFEEFEIRNMSDVFVHSVTVPRIYKFTADIVRRVREDGASLKALIYERKHPVSVKQTIVRRI